MIWDLAMGGHMVAMSGHTDHPSSKHQTVDAIIRGKPYKTYGEELRYTVSAFHLPEVCRQIYLETSTLGYALNTFVFFLGHRGDYIDAMKVWGANLPPALAGVITDIGFSSYAFDFWRLGIFKPISKALPALKRIHIPKFMLEREDIERLARYCQQCFKQRYDLDVEMVFNYDEEALEDTFCLFPLEDKA
jgi:hypothetical protein